MPTYPKTKKPTRIVRGKAVEFIEILSPSEAYKCAVEKGWWRRHRPFAELLCLLHSEISETLEEYRKPSPNTITMSKKVREELADIVIRLWDMCGYYGIDIAQEVLKKHFKNLKRPYRHGGKRC